MASSTIAALGSVYVPPAAAAATTMDPTGPTMNVVLDNLAAAASTMSSDSATPLMPGEKLTSAGGGALQLSPMGIGTWSWGNQFVWGYSEEMDPELQRVFDAAVAAGINLFDTADSYGTGSGLDGRSEVLLGEATVPGVRTRVQPRRRRPRRPARRPPARV